MSDRRRVLVVGASGFIGRGVVSALSSAGHTVSPLPGPRLAPMPASAAASFIASSPLVHELASTFSDVDAVVNAAGNPDASETHADALISPNAVLPGLLAAACRAADPSPRLVHISSAVVQGRASELDASRRTEGFSVYARSKILGETLALEHAPESTVVYRPPSVHAVDRRVTRMIEAVARSPLPTMARPTVLFHPPRPSRPRALCRCWVEGGRVSCPGGWRRTRNASRCCGPASRRHPAG